jgi:hypothetical protein
MDKLKIFLANAKKYQFWICCGVMLLTSLGCWWWASGNLAKLFNTRKTEIDADFAAATVTPGSPNQGVIDAITKVDPTTQEDSGKLGKLKHKVYRAWETLYAEQKKNNPFPTDILGEDFKKAFEKLQLPKDELDPKYLEIYQNYIKNYLPNLEKIVDVRKEVRKGDGGGLGGGLGGITPGLDAGVDYSGIVDWDPGDYGQLEAHFDWRGRPPTTLEVAMSQEDLWVYEALLLVIKKVNQGATTQANASIKKIVALDIGRDSAAAWAEARQAVFAGGGAGPNVPGMPGGGAPMPGGMPGGVPGGAPGGTAAAGSADEQALFRDRYIDAKGQPLPYDPAYPHAAHSFSEFKMMPVFMSFVMDQRYLPALLVACANSSMPIEVKSVRILKETVAALDSSGGGGGLPGGMGRGMAGGGGMPMPGGGGMPMPGGRGGGMMPMPGGGGMMPMPGGGGMPMRGVGGGGMMPMPGGGGMMPGGRRPPGGAASAGAPQTLTGPTDVPVQICAVIYIYNPPDRAKLGIPEEKSPAGAAAPANATTPPAGAPATPSTATPGK